MVSSGVGRRYPYMERVAGIPCGLAALAPPLIPTQRGGGKKLRFAKGRESACVAFLWMEVSSDEAPVLAGMA